VKISAKNIHFANQVFTRHGGVQLAGATRLKVARISRAVRTEGETIRDALADLALEHAEKDADGKPVIIQTAAGPDYAIADRQAWRAAEKQLMAGEIELPLEALTIAEISDDKPGFTDITDALLPFAEAPKA
jgi:hypothetical protein